MPSKIYDQKGDLIKELGNGTVTCRPMRFLITYKKCGHCRRSLLQAGRIDPIRWVPLSVIFAGSISEGGSTITQQLVKNSGRYSLTLRTRQNVRSRLVSTYNWSVSIGPNTDILSQQLFYSNNTYGARAAARLFFGKELSQLTVEWSGPLSPSASSVILWSLCSCKRLRNVVMLSWVSCSVWKLVSQAQYDGPSLSQISSSNKHWIRAPWITLIWS